MIKNIFVRNINHQTCINEKRGAIYDKEKGTNIAGLNLKDLSDEELNLYKEYWLSYYKENETMHMYSCDLLVGTSILSEDPHYLLKHYGFTYTHEPLYIQRDVKYDTETGTPYFMEGDKEILLYEGVHDKELFFEYESETELFFEYESETELHP